MQGIYFLAVVLVIALISSVILVAIYNRLVRSRMLVREAFSGVDVQLKQRHNLIPNLINTVQGYADFERSVLDEVVRLRLRAMGDQSISDKQRDENALSAGLKTLFAVAENYPELKAGNNFLDLQQQLSGIEDNLQKARRYYNGTVRDFNIQVESFPSNLIAGLFEFTPAEFFELESLTERELPKVEFKDTK
ncbi:MAG: LemA family protein [Fuerstiella sp.]|nr:LemA family protein [Fuerstiella sp.]